VYVSVSVSECVWVWVCVWVCVSVSVWMCVWVCLCVSEYTALMYSSSYLEPVCCSMSSSNCCFLTCIQVSQEAGQVVWYSHLFQNFLHVPTWSGQDCHRTLEKYFLVSVPWEYFILKSHLFINDCVCTELFWGSLTWWHHWAGCRSYFLLSLFWVHCAKNMF